MNQLVAMTNNDVAGTLGTALLSTGLFTGLVALSAPAFSECNAVLNGGFERGLSDWTQPTNDSLPNASGGRVQAIAGSNAHSGSWSARITGSSVMLAQTVDVTPGLCALGFYLATRGCNASCQLQVRIDSQLLASSSVDSAADSVTKTTTYDLNLVHFATANLSAQLTLTFAGAKGGIFNIDDVNICCSPPTTSAMQAPITAAAIPAPVITDIVGSVSPDPQTAVLAILPASPSEAPIVHPSNEAGDAN